MNTTAPKVSPTGRYSINETATHLDISRRTVERHIKAGTIATQYREATKRPYVTGLEILKVWNKTV